MFSAYTVAVRIALEDKITHGLLGLSGHFTHLHGQAGALNKQLKQIALTAMGGGVMLGIGTGMAKMFDKPIARAIELQNEIAKLNTLPISGALSERIINAAGNAGVATSSQIDNLKLLREIIPTFGAVGPHRDHLIGEAIEAMPYLAKATAMIGAFGGGHGGDDHLAQNMVRIMDASLKGQSATPQFIEHHMQMLTKALLTQQGVLKSDQYLLSAKQAGSAWMGYSDEFKYGIVPTLIAEGGGGGGQVGTWLKYLDRTVMGKRAINRSNRAVWLASGLVDQSDFIDNGVTTGSNYLKPGSIKGHELAESNPFQWILQYVMPVLPKLQKQFGMSEKQALDMLLGNSTQSGAMASILLNRRVQLQRDLEMFHENGGLANYQKMLETSPQLMNVAWAMQQKEIDTQLGKIIVPIQMWFMQFLLPNLEGLAKWMKANPTLVQGLVIAFGALAGTLSFAGTVWLLNASFRALSIGLGLLEIGATGTQAGFILRSLGAGLQYLFGPLAAARTFGGVLMGIGRVFTRFFIGGPLTLFGRAVVMLWGVIANPITWIVALFVAIGAAFVVLYHKWAPFRLFVDGAVSVIGKLFNGIMNAVGGFFNWIGKMLHIPASGMGGLLKWATTDSADVAAAVKSAKETKDGSRFVPKKNQRGGTGQGAIYLDGRVVGKMMAEEHARAASGAPVSASSFNPRSTPIPAGAGAIGR